ncbi:MAG TPA: DNA-processing protein DprA [Thermomicrobiales bacterium]|jgi:predicted Rossmann fold nucleotide-binding protein DprA/Smf involved in DNA uptake
MNPAALSDDGLAMVTLCSRLVAAANGGEPIKPLTTTEWNGLAVRLAASPWERPRGLLGRTEEELRATLDLDGSMAVRFARLLDRAGLVSLEVERLANRGIWATTRMDEGFPPKWKARLGSQAPPVLFGAGAASLLDREGAAVVGSRDVDAVGAEFAEEVGRRCAGAGVLVVSGGARGVDRLAIGGALAAEGEGVAVLADSLDRLARGAENRRFVADGRLTLVSPFHPGAGFQVGNAMARNKLIYCLADVAVVIASSHKTGGTWHGAIENLRQGWVPLFVRDGETAPDGNRVLIAEGGIALPALPDERDLLVWFRDRAAATPRQEQSAAQLALLTD